MSRTLHVFIASCTSLLLTACGGEASSAHDRVEPESAAYTEKALSVGDTVWVTEGDPLPESPAGTEWVATGQSRETWPPQHEYVLQATVDPNTPVSSGSSTTPTDTPSAQTQSPAVVIVSAGQHLPIPPAGQRYVLFAILETMPAQYRFELQPGVPTHLSFSTLFDWVAWLYASSEVTKEDVELTMTLALNDGVVRGYERQLLTEAAAALDDQLTPDAQAALQDFLSNN